MRVGDIEVVPVVDVEAGDVIQSVLPDATSARIAELDWLVPVYADGCGRLLAPVQSFLVKAERATILVDCGVGDGKRRSDYPQWDDLSTGFLDRLRDRGHAPDAITLVVCTHLHVDHVGWNTSWISGRWQPTFAHATYVFVGAEYEYWLAEAGSAPADVAAAFADSVVPVVEAERVRFARDDEEIAPGVRFVPTPGHTPAHASVEISSRGERALISGDLLHHPCQIAHPEWASTADADPEAAVETRRRVLGDLARNGTTLIGSHFAGSAACRVSDDRGTLAFEPR